MIDEKQTDATRPADRPRQVKLYGRPDSPAAFELRDFLSRSVVEFEWIEIATEDDSPDHLGIADLKSVSLPVVEFPDGQRLFAPAVREVAARLGWIQQPRLCEYDLSIYGAGPAGLSAAVYAASEGIRTVLLERQAIGGPERAASSRTTLASLRGSAEPISQSGPASKQSSSE